MEKARTNVESEMFDVPCRKMQRFNIPCQYTMNKKGSWKIPWLTIQIHFPLGY